MNPASQGEQRALLEAWGQFLSEGWIRKWPQERAETVYRAFVFAWVKGHDHHRAVQRLEGGPIPPDPEPPVLPPGDECPHCHDFYLYLINHIRQCHPDA